MKISDLSVIRDWVGRVGDFDLRQFALHNVSPATALVVSSIFWPGFIEVDGLVFVDFLFHSESVEVARRRFDEKAGDVERFINVLHIWDVLRPADDADYVALEELAKTVGEMWAARVRRQYPDREFVVRVDGDGSDYGPTVTLYPKQAR